MNLHRATVIGFVLIGTFAFLDGLGDVVQRYFAMLQLSKLLSGPVTVSGAPVAFGGVVVPLFVGVLFDVLPGFLLIVARYRIAAWLLPPSTDTVELGPSHEMFRLGFVLLGIYLVITGASAIPNLLSFDIRFGGVLFSKKYYAMAAPMVRITGGILLWAFARPLSRRLARD